MKGIINKIGAGLAVVAGLATVASSLVAVPVYAAGNCDVNGGIMGSVNESCSQGSNTPSNLFGNGGIFTTVINTMLFIVGILAVVMIIFSGIRYVTAHGDKAQVESAKNTLMYAIIGLVIAIVAYALVNWVVSLFGGGNQ